MLTATPNEHPGKLDRVRQRVRDFKIAPKPLLGGDYTFEANGKVVAIEVKWSLSDLFDSLKSVGGENGGPRLAVEVRKMLAYADIPWLIVPPLRDRGDGLALRDDGQVSGWQYSSIKGILADVALYGVVVEEYDGDISQRIAQLYYTITKREHGWIAQRGRPDYISLDPLLPQAIWSLCAWDMVGPVLAEELLKGQHKTVTEVGEMSLKELQKVPGVGPKVARSIHEGMNRRW